MNIPENEIEWSFARSGGPGGQNVNKVSSKALLRWDVVHSPSLPEYLRQRLMLQQKNSITTEGELLITSQRHRDQEQNRQDCLDKLTAMLQQASTLPKARRPTRATRSSVERRLQSKQKRSGVKLARRQPPSD